MKYRAVLAVMVFALMLPGAMRAGQAPTSAKRAPAPQSTRLATGISGTWAVVVTFPGAPGMPDGGFRATVTLKQNVLDPLKPGPLDGYFTRQDANGGAFTGIVNDRKVTFTTVFKSSSRPGVTEIHDFIGTLDGENTIKGNMISVSTGPGTYMRGEGPFVATRVPSRP